MCHFHLLFKNRSSEINAVKMFSKQLDLSREIAVPVFVIMLCENCELISSWFRSRNQQSCLHSKSIAGHHKKVYLMFTDCHITPITPDPLEHCRPTLHWPQACPERSPARPCCLPTSGCLPPSLLWWQVLLLSDGAAEKLAQRQFSFQSCNMKSAPLLRKWTHCFQIKLCWRGAGEQGWQKDWGQWAEKTKLWSFFLFSFHFKIFS